MNWDDLRVFLALAREGSASAAARTLEINHTTVARRIRALEAAMATRLFDRTAEGYVMTQAAENMYTRAVAMEETAQAIARTTAGRDAQLEGPLRITVPYDFAARVLVPHLGEFRQRYPAIDLHLLTTADIVDLAAREADIAVRLTARPPDYLVGRDVLPLRHGIYASPNYFDKLPGPAPSVLLFRGEQGPPPWVSAHFAGATVAMRIDNVVTMLAAVKAGLGIARLPRFIGDDSDGVVRLPVALAPSPWRVWVLSHVDLRSSARVRAGREFLIDAITRSRALIEGNEEP